MLLRKAGVGSSALAGMQSSSKPLLSIETTVSRKRIRHQSESVTAPLPHLGISYTYAFTPTVGMNLGVKGFAVAIDNIDGSIIEIDADVAWQPFKHVGFGVGARYFKTEVDSKGSRLDGNIKFEYFGPSVYIQATF